MYRLKDHADRVRWFLAFIFLFTIPQVVLSASNSPTLEITQTISAEPLLGGQATFEMTLTNNGNDPVEDKGYNLSITDVLPAGISFNSADPAPTFVSREVDGTTTIYWDNIADLEVAEELIIMVVADIDPSLPSSSNFLNAVSAEMNDVPDNSGNWIAAENTLPGGLQAIDIEMKPIQSTADEQATGAGEFDGAADWPYQYEITVQNNNVGSTDDVVATAVLPSGVAYMGNPTISPNPNGATAAPDLTLLADGSLEMVWALGTLTTAEHADPVVIRFDAAIPYAHRTGDDTAAELGAFAGEMSGVPIAEDTVMPVEYEAVGTYNELSTSDGTGSTPLDDKPATVTAEYLALSKTGTPKTVGIGTEVTFNLSYFVSEYYTTTDVVIQDVLPDGMTYVKNSGSLTPVSIETDTPAAGQTLITWNVDAADTTAGSQGTISFRATVDELYENGALSGQPIVSGDSLTNVANSNGNWADTQSDRSGALIEDKSHETVYTTMPTFTKEVYNPETGGWGDLAWGYTGDTIRFRLTYNAANNIDARNIIIRDFLPRGMTYVDNSDTYAISNKLDFSNSSDCQTAPATPTISTLNGLQFLQWDLCNTEMRTSWQVEIEALVGERPDVQPGWIVGNFGKLSGMNSADESYSQRAFANTEYRAPELQLTKSASPSTNLDGGDTTTFTIEVTNIGRAAAYNAIVTDLIPPRLLVPNSGTGYKGTSGNPAAGEGGTLTWETIPVIFVGETVELTYSATIPDDALAGESMLNIASVAYNSRFDDTGEQTAATNDTADINTDDAELFVRGVSISKSADREYATIGETVGWTLTVTVPANTIAYWPIVSENNLPDGFDYVTGSSLVTAATLDTTNHAVNPIDNGNKDLRWMFETIDNSGSSTSYQFTVEFDTLITGVDGADSDTTYYNNNCCYEDADNKAFVGWYDDATGYDGTGYAYHAFGGRNHVDFRSPQAAATVIIRQPFILFNKVVEQNEVGAGDAVTYTIQASNVGNDIAWDLTLDDVLPAGVTYESTVYSGANPAADWFSYEFKEDNAAGETNPQWFMNGLPVGQTWTVVYRATVDADISANVTLTNTATIPEYSSRPGTPADTNGDSLNDERVYAGVKDSAIIYTPAADISKQSVVLDDELTVNSTIRYTITVPATPINATMSNVVVTDVVDDRLVVTGVKNGSHEGNRVTAKFDAIRPMTQETIIIEAAVPANTTAVDNIGIPNQATSTYDNGVEITSNIVNNTFVAPALVVDKTVDEALIAEGDILNYTITVQNVGHGAAHAITIKDTLPSNMSWITGSAQLNGALITNPSDLELGWPFLTGVTLDANESLELTFQAIVNSAEADTSYTNVVEASAIDTHGNMVPADNSVLVPADTDPTDDGSATVYGPLTFDRQNAIYVAYEDLRNISYVDWDYNDFIVGITAEYAAIDGNIVAMRLAYDSIARGADLNHRFLHELPVKGGGVAYVTNFDTAGNPIHTNLVPFGEDSNIPVYENTNVALPVPDGFNFTNTEPNQVTYAEGQTAQMIVILNEPSSNPLLTIAPLPWDPWIYVYGTDQEVHLPIPGHSDNMQIVNSLFDPTTPLQGYSLPLARVIDPVWQWPEEAIGMWRSHPLFIDNTSSGGAMSNEWHMPANANADWIWQNVPTARGRAFLAPYEQVNDGARYFASPVLSDLDGDGTQEIVIGSLHTNRLEVRDLAGNLIWERTVDDGIKGTTRLADVTGDGNSEIIFGTHGGSVHAYTADGSRLAGFPLQIAEYGVLSTPAVADLDGGGSEIIVSAADGRLYVIDADAATVKWSASLGDVLDLYGSQFFNSSPTIANIDADPEPEILVGSYDAHLYAYNHDGSRAWAYETGDVILSTPVAADIDPNSPGLEIVFGSNDANVTMLAADGTMLWQQPTGWFVRATPQLADMDEDGDIEILIGSDDDRLWAFHHDGSFVAGFPVTTQGDIVGTPAIGDIDGDSVSEIVIGSADAQLYAYEMDGTAVAGWPQATDVSIFGSPTLTDINDDPALEVIVADFNGNLYTFDVTTVAPTAVTLNQIDTHSTNFLLLTLSFTTLSVFVIASLRRD